MILVEHLTAKNCRKILSDSCRCWQWTVNCHRELVNSRIGIGPQVGEGRPLGSGWCATVDAVVIIECGPLCRAIKRMKADTFIPILRLHSRYMPVANIQERSIAYWRVRIVVLA